MVEMVVLGIVVETELVVSSCGSFGRSGDIG